MGSTRELYQSALRLYREDRLQEAISALEEALETDPQFSDAYEVLGLLYEKKGDVDRAISVTKKLAEADPDHVMAHTNLSRFYVRKGMIQEAEREQAEARRLSWKAELRGQKLGRQQEERLETEQAEARRLSLLGKIEDFKKVIELDPQDVLGYFSLGTVYLECQFYEKARKAFEEAVRVDPRHSPSYVGLGQALETLGKTEEAAQVYRVGIRAADERGDIVPLRKMETRLKALRGES